MNLGLNSDIGKTRVSTHGKTQEEELNKIVQTCAEPLTSTLISGFEARSSYFPAHWQYCSLV